MSTNNSYDSRQQESLCRKYFLNLLRQSAAITATGGLLLPHCSRPNGTLYGQLKNLLFLKQFPDRPVIPTTNGPKRHGHQAPSTATSATNHRHGHQAASTATSATNHRLQNANCRHETASPLFRSYSSRHRGKHRCGKRGADKSSQTSVSSAFKPSMNRQPDLCPDACLDIELSRALQSVCFGLPCTARYFSDQVPLEESPSTPLPNALISPLPKEHVPLSTRSMSHNQEHVLLSTLGACPTVNPGRPPSVGAGGGPSSTNGNGTMDPGVLGMAV